LKGKLPGMVSQPTQGEIPISKKMKTRTLGRLVQTKTLDPLSRRIMQRAQTLKNPKRTLK